MTCFYHWFPVLDLEKEVDVSFYEHSNGSLEDRAVTSDTVIATPQRSEGSGQRGRNAKDCSADSLSPPHILQKNGEFFPPCSPPIFRMKIAKQVHANDQEKGHLRQEISLEGKGEGLLGCQYCSLS